MIDHYKFCCISYQKRTADGCLSSCSNEDDWQECVVGPLSSYSGYGEQRFTRNPNSEFQINSLISLLRQAFIAGQQAKLAEIQSILGIRP